MPPRAWERINQPGPSPSRYASSRPSSAHGTGIIPLFVAANTFAATVRPSVWHWVACGARRVLLFRAPAKYPSISPTLTRCGETFRRTCLLFRLLLDGSSDEVRSLVPRSGQIPPAPSPTTCSHKRPADLDCCGETFRHSVYREIGRCQGGTGECFRLFITLWTGVRYGGAGWGGREGAHSLESEAAHAMASRVADRDRGSALGRLERPGPIRAVYGRQGTRSPDATAFAQALAKVESVRNECGGGMKDVVVDR